MLEEQLMLLQQELRSLQQEQVETKAEAERARAAALEAQDQAQEIIQAQDAEEVDPVLTDGPPKVKLAISGHINRAVNVAADGDNTKAYFVDNDVSTSRFRLVGSADLGGGATVGTQIELGISPNNSFDVNQRTEDSGDFFDQRKVEAYVRHDDYGRVQLGKGSTASEDTAEYDLSLVAGPIHYSGVADIVGGLNFVDGETLTGIRVADAFFNFDGLGRKDRVTYDSPIIGPGLQISGSAISNQRWDVALKWGADYDDWSGVEIGDFLTLAAVSLSDPQADGVDYRFNGSASVLHQPTGLSLTVSGGIDKNNGNDDDPHNIYGKLAWDTEFFSFGPTGFGIDFTRGKDICADCDNGYSSGLGFVQVLEDWGIELFAQARWYTLDVDPSLDSVSDMWVGTVGTRAKF